MKVQYFGDVNDYRKFALLRLLACDAGFKIGVCWMMTDKDARSDGRIRGYLREPEKWQGFDPELFAALKTVPLPTTLAELQRIEKEGLIPGAAFFYALTPDELTARRKFHNRCMSSLAETELVFVDPDNGLEVPSCKKGRKDSSKFAFYDEIADHYACGRSVLMYQHFPRQTRSAFLAHISDRIRSHLPGSFVWLFETGHSVLFLASQKDHSARVITAVRAVEQQWVPKLFKSMHLCWGAANLIASNGDS